MKLKLVVLIAYLTVGAGCGDAGAQQDLAEARAVSSTASHPNATAAPSSGVAASGNATCDSYWVKLKACNDSALKSAPDSVQERMRKGFDDTEKQTKEGWSKMDPAGLETACKKLIDDLVHNPNCPR